MKYCQYGASGRRVSSVMCGCMRIAGMDDAAVDRLVMTGIEAGINCFDHADIYGGGESERAFGRVLASNTGLREQVFIQSKCGIRAGFFDFSREHIVRSVDGMLSRLGVEYIDALLLHRPDALMEPEEVAAAFDELEAAGKVRHFGVSNQSPVQMALLRTAVRQPLCANQLQLSLCAAGMVDSGLRVNNVGTAASVYDSGVLEEMRLHGVTVQAWSPMQYGMFGGCFIGSDKYPALNALLSELAEKYGTAPEGIATAWILRIPGRMQVITGTTSPERLANMAQAADITLSREEWYALYRAAGYILP